MTRSGALLLFVALLGGCHDKKRAQLRACFPGLEQGRVRGILGHAASEHGEAAAVFSPQCPRVAMRVTFAAPNPFDSIEEPGGVYSVDGEVAEIDYAQREATLKPGSRVTPRHDLTIEQLQQRYSAGEVIR